MEPKHIIVIGTSAGGLNALNEIVSQLEKDWDAAFLIVLHLSRKGIADFLVFRLQQYTTLKCVLGADGITIEKGHIYIAPPAYHLLVRDGQLRLGRGPEENRWKPSIDVLFRSAAATYNGRVTGIILTGLHDDGTSGMSAIKRSGGTSIVQDPNQAEYPEMPMSVLNKMEVDYCVPLVEMGTVLKDIIINKIPEETTVPSEVVAEAAIAEKMATSIENVEALGDRSNYTCPDCGGSLWQVRKDVAGRYRCFTGHSYTEADLVVKQSENIEATLWVALRMMEERKNLLKKMERQTRDRGFERFAKDHMVEGREVQHHIDTLRDLLFVENSDQQ
ncbi:MAG TPA: chemotaxis protein CheB [Chitinophagaceae bacterium]|jgi:two-component system chemotaxis response regulator CheB|nr:chemotaxis protein CheB [Chitinophagaceae bacterium]